MHGAEYDANYLSVPFKYQIVIYLLVRVHTVWTILLAIVLFQAAIDTTFYAIILIALSEVDL